jgi:hypothetical protein
MISEIPIDLTDDEIKTRIDELLLKENVFDRVGLDKLLITFEDMDGKRDGERKLDGLTFGDKITKMEEYTPIEREVIFIKYDNVNLKYLYVCSTCNSSWKNT